MNRQLFILPLLLLVTKALIGQELNTYDALYAHLELSVDPASPTINGKVSHHIRISKNTTSPTWDFKSNMQVDSILVNGESVSFNHESDLLSIQSDSEYETGKIYTVEIHYKGDPERGEGYFNRLTHSNIPVMWTRSQPYGAMNWWPCKNSLNDRLDSIRITLVADTPYFGVANGTLEKSDTSNGVISNTYFHSYSIPVYLVAIAATNYELYAYSHPLLNEVDSLSILNYIYPEEYQSSIPEIHYTSVPMSIFQNLFGEYPYTREHYGHARCEIQGGMEHSTMSFMANFNKGLIAHELAHQWFGNVITCGSWQDLWLNEGFATYLTGLTYELSGDTALWSSWRSGALNSIFSQRGGSVYATDTSSFASLFNGRLQYNKGAYVLHMLRWELGDEDFFQGLRNYIEDSTLRFSSARTEDFRKHMEVVSGRNLANFFQLWVYEPGYPELYAVWRNRSDALQLNLNQKSSVNRADLIYPLKIVVRLIFVDNSFEEHIINLNNAEDEFEFPINKRVKAVELDPEKWLMVDFEIREEDEITSSVQAYPNPVIDKLNLRLNFCPTIDYLEISSETGVIYYFTENLQSPMELDFSTYPAGQYYIRVICSDSETVIPVIKSLNSIH